MAPKIPRKIKTNAADFTAGKEYSIEAVDAVGNVDTHYNFMVRDENGKMRCINDAEATEIIYE